MAFVFVVETGSGLSNANSYCSVSFANDYHEKKLRTAATWAALTTQQKEYRLAEATEIVDRECAEKWAGCAAHLRPTEQRLYWPRYDVRDGDGQWLESDVIPEELKSATAELALRLTEKDLDKEPLRRSFSALSVGSINLTPAASDPPVLIRSVMHFLRPFLKMGGSSAFGKAVR